MKKTKQQEFTERWIKEKEGPEALALYQAKLKLLAKVEFLKTILQEVHPINPSHIHDELDNIIALTKPHNWEV